MSNQQRRLIPVYTTRGDVGGYLAYPNIYNRQGEWIGWVTPEREVYSVHGAYVGYMTNDPRVLRKVSDSFDRPAKDPPSRPSRILPPPTVPLPAMMPELLQGVIDVFDDDPDLLQPIDYGGKDLD